MSGRCGEDDDVYSDVTFRDVGSNLTLRTVCGFSCKLPSRHLPGDIRLLLTPFYLASVSNFCSPCLKAIHLVSELKL